MKPKSIVHKKPLAVHKYTERQRELPKKIKDDLNEIQSWYIGGSITEEEFVIGVKFLLAKATHKQIYHLTTLILEN